MSLIGKNKLTIAQMKEILDSKGKMNREEAAQQFGVHIQTVWRIWAGKSKKLNRVFEKDRKSLLNKLVNYFVDEDTDRAIKADPIALAKMEKLNNSLTDEELYILQEELI